MKSMTGFSEASLHKDGIQFKCFVKSLNSRFIEINIRLPNSLKKHEGWVRDSIKKNFARGKIDFDLNCTTPAKDQLKLSENFLKLVKQNENVAGSKGIELADLTYLDLLKLRDSIQSDYVLSAVSLKSLVKESLSNLQKNCLQDGESTKRDVKKLLSKMGKSIAKIKKKEKLNTNHVAKKFQRLKKEFQFKDQEINVNEIISSFSKADINEEIVRFKSHLELVTKLSESKALIGKKMDFYSQEMLREANTIASKAQIVDIKNEAVELKCLIEKMKEHAQNVE